jgi:hypothetical protein
LIYVGHQLKGLVHLQELLMSRGEILPESGVGWAGVVLVLIGVGLAFWAIRGILLYSRFFFSSNRIGEPLWLRDYPWNHKMSYDPTGTQIFVRLFLALVAGAFLLPFNMFAFAPKGDDIFLLFVVIPDMLLVAFLVHLSYKIMHWIKYGGIRFEFAEVPFRLGGTLAGRLVIGAAVEAKTLTCTLRCIQEELRYRGGTSRGAPRLVAVQVLRQIHKISVPSCDGDEDQVVEVSFPIPYAGGRMTQLSQRAPTYWELVVDADTPGVDLHAVFLVPIY